MMRAVSVALALASITAVPAAADVATGLKGSPASMIRQHRVASANDYTFLRSGSQVHEFVENGYLVPVPGNEDYEVLKGVSFPFARPELRTFIERISKQHREACGERLVVTSLTRPTAGQPANSHPLSVHPAGMAVDLRVLGNAACRQWLESTLLGLERKGLLDATRERRPPHYHVALFTGAYAEYVAPLIAAEEARAAEERRALQEAQARAAADKLAAASTSMLVPAAVEPAHDGAGGDRWLIAALPLVALALGFGFVRRAVFAPRRRD